MLFHTELGLPARGVSQRVTQRKTVAPDETLTLFDEAGPGCVLHWWLTYTPGGESAARDRAHDLYLRIFYDGEETPAVEVTLAQFFGILLDRDVYAIHSAAITVLPKNACNCYLPLPFGAMRMELVNRNDAQTCIWFMADWQAYPDYDELTPLRLRVIPRAEYPAHPAGSYLMADITGQGFVAGMTKAVRVKDDTDHWFHSGGDLWLLDGETAPRPMRGIGGEDIFNMSFGVWDAQAPWVGTPYLTQDDDRSSRHPGYECMNYRFFGPDPIWFDTSAVVRFGSKANDIETVVYAYVESRQAPSILTPDTWTLAGPFSCGGEDDFSRREWAEDPIGAWPKDWTPGFGQYVSDHRTAAFPMPVRAESEHTWCDFARHFRGCRITNHGTQPLDVSAYAVAMLRIDTPGPYRIHIGFDDWMTLWVDGNEIYSGRHDAGFREDTVTRSLPAGEVELRIKLSNQDNFQWRLWAFSLRIDRG